MLTAAVPAQAEPIDAAEMTSRMERYFTGEKEEGWVFGGVGLAGLGTGAFLLTRDDDVARGASIPILAVGAIETIIGAVLLIRTDGQIRERRRRIATEPGPFRTEELARIEGVNSSFRVLFWTELALVVGGTTTAILASLNDAPFWEGIGIGLAAQAAIALVLDLFAAARATRYSEALSDFEP
jgi:hypothetical protein